MKQSDMLHKELKHMTMAELKEIQRVFPAAVSGSPLGKRIRDVRNEIKSRGG